MSLSADEAANVNERLLASVYKQAESAEQGGDVAGAVDHYLRIATLDPSSELAAKGHYDAVAILEQSGDVAGAAALLTQFRKQYPDHELGRDVNMRLATMYESVGDRPAAAREFVTLSESASDRDVRRQSKYRAAEIYLELGDHAQALEHFRGYANTYETPRQLAMEAMHQVDLLYQQSGDLTKRRFWLQKKIDLHKKMGRSADARATYLAADAAMFFAAEERRRFEAVRLTRPLKASLKKKQRALKATVASYEAVASYQVEAFSTASTYQIADLYAGLSRAIMVSERPADLSELELEQYEILLEEQAFPFEEQAIEIHEINMRRSWAGTYDDWVKRSFEALSKLMPARFDKQELEYAYVEAIH